MFKKKVVLLEGRCVHARSKATNFLGERFAFVLYEIRNALT